MRRAARGSLLGGVIGVRQMRKLGDTGRQVAPIRIDLSRQRRYGAHVSVALCLNADRLSVQRAEPGDGPGEMNLS